MAHFTTDLPDWKIWRNLNENKNLPESKTIELYKDEIFKGSIPGTGI